jgi:DNA-binding response OmpR family regulator
VSPTAQLRPVLTTQGDRYTVAAIVVQESTGEPAAAELTALASRLAEEARRLLQEERPGAAVTAAVALSDPARAALSAAPDDDAAAAQSAGPEKAGLEIDRHAYRVSADGRPVELSFREFELLAFLAEHPGRVFSRRQLVSSVWDGAEVGSRTVDVHVRRLRMKLGRHADRIVTVRNVGYRYEPAGADLETVA